MRPLMCLVLLFVSAEIGWSARHQTLAQGAATAVSDQTWPVKLGYQQDKRMIADEPQPQKHAGGRPPVAQMKLNDFGVTAVCDAIADGVSLTAIAENVGVSKGALLIWINSDNDRSARILEARRVTSWHWDELAEKEIRDAPPTSEGIAKARELASHFRWRASKIDIRYGDKTHLQQLDKDGNPTDAPRAVQIEIIGTPPAQVVEPSRGDRERAVVDIDVVGRLTGK